MIIKQGTYIFIYCLFIQLGFSQNTESNYSRYVNPFIGTGGHGHTFPGATVPFGMVQLSPDTRIDGSWDGCGGYHYSDSVIYGFSHTHLSGTGCSDYGDIMFMPNVGNRTVSARQYASSFSHQNEKASAGYYNVRLNNGVNVELTSTARVGFHKYTFPQNAPAQVVLDLTHRDKTLHSYVKITGKRSLEGYRRSEAWAKDQYIYFTAEFSEDMDWEIFLNDKTMQGQLLKDNYYSGENVKAIFSCANLKKPLYLKVALSLVSAEGAKKNLMTELPDWDFDKTKKSAEELWNKELSKIEVTSSDEDKLTVFYTALYHTMVQPNTAMDVDGQYRGRDNKIHKAEGFTYYSVFSLWDTFRGAHPLYTLIDQKRTADFINTFLMQYEQGGRLPVWELAGNETDCMIGYHAVSVMADAMAKGIKGFDYNKAFEAAKHSAMLDHLGLQAYKNKGVITMDDEHESVSKTLEYAYDDWCIAQMAKLLNKTSDYDYFMKRSNFWKNCFDPVSRFMRPRKNGGWLEPFDPKEVNNNFTEGNSWQYSFFVPQDVYGLIQLSGGAANFDKQLDELFSTGSATTGRTQADITGLVGQYAQGNEPSHHMAYLYNYIGKNSKTQSIVRKLLLDFYKNSPDGLIGNEDCGQMSAWYVLGSMGIYQVCPGSTYFEIGSPIFTSAKIHLENGKLINLFSTNYADTHPYIKSVSVNGNTYSQSAINYLPQKNKTGLMDGLTVKFELSDKPANFSAAASKKKLIPKTDNFILSPIIVTPALFFKEKQKVEIKSLTPNCKIYYSTDSAKPTVTSKQYKEPFEITNTTTVKAIAINDKGQISFISEGTFYKTPHPNWKVILKSKYNSQYSAGGDDGLIDGLHGTTNWRAGSWQGYQSQDFECVVDMGKEMQISSVTTSYLQDTRSWILFPKEITYSVSSDGVNYKTFGVIENGIDPSDYSLQTREFNHRAQDKTGARYVKIKAVNFGKLPNWHQGKGEDAFIFIDEIEIK